MELEKLIAALIKLIRIRRLSLILQELAKQCEKTRLELLGEKNYSDMNYFSALQVAIEALYDLVLEAELNYA